MSVLSKLKALSVLKLGDIANGNKRIWIANRNIHKSMDTGDRLRVSYDKGEITIERTDGIGSHCVSYRKDSTPIIDIKNAGVLNAFGDCEKVEVLFFKGKIVVRASYKDRKKQERSSKSQNTLFEFFCGGGTLTHMFKHAGYRSVGSLDIMDKYLAVYEANHLDNTESVTFCAGLDEVDPRHFQNIEAGVVLAGIPCTNYTVANLSLHREMKKQRDGLNYDADIIGKQFDAEALTHYLLRAIEAINPKTVVVEEVEEYCKADGAVNMLRAVLLQMGYSLSENVITSNLTKRKRWVLVANMGSSISLDNVNTAEGCTFAELLPAEREWMKLADSKRLTRASQSIGVRDVDFYESNMRINTLTTHATRGTEPCFSKTSPDGTKLYSELSNEDIKAVHGLGGFQLSGVKTNDRQILGQGVTDVFKVIASRILNQRAGDCLPVRAISAQGCLF